MSGPRFSSQAGLASLRHGRQVILTPDAVQGMVPRDGEAAYRAGDRIVPARQAEGLLAAVEALPRKWRIRRTLPVGKLRFGDMVLPARPAGWQVTAPTCAGRFSHIFDCACEWFPTWEQAVAYATERARAEQLAAITHSEGTDALPADLETP